MSCLTQPTDRVVEVHVTQGLSVFPARGNWWGRLDLIDGGGRQYRRRNSKLKPRAVQKAEVMTEDSGQISCRVTRPGEDQSLRTLPNMTMQSDVRWYVAHPVEHQAMTVPDPQPQMRPPAATGNSIQEEKRKQQTNNPSSHPE